MKNKILFLVIFLSLTWPMHAVQIVSLGFNCRPAQALFDEHLRNASYPFDWIWTQADQLYKVIDDDFAHFLEPESLKPGHRGILDYYGLHFMHDFPTEHGIVDSPARSDWKDFIPIVREKYLRRINRFKNLLSGSEKIYLIRYYLVTKAQAIALRDLFIKKYPKLDFTLVVVSDSPDFKQDWQLSQIKNFHYVNVNSQNQADKNTWKMIFDTLGLDILPITRSWCYEFICDGICHKFH